MLEDRNITAIRKISKNNLIDILREDGSIISPGTLKPDLVNIYMERLASQKVSSPVVTKTISSPDVIQRGNSVEQMIRHTLDRVHTVRLTHFASEDAGQTPVTHPEIPIEPIEFGRCTSTACYIAQKYGGKVMGYEPEDDTYLPHDRVGDAGGGHDFAIIGDRYLADYWAKDYQDLPDLYDLQNPVHMDLIRERYGEPKYWLLTYDYSNPEEKNPWIQSPPKSSHRN